MLQAAPKSEVIINLSLDGVGCQHDEIRGVRNNWTHAMATYSALKELKNDYKNLTVGIHTVISNFNVGLFAELCEYVQRELKPDSYITEIAEERVELDTVGLGITPTAERYTVAIDTLLESMRDQHLTGVAEVTQAFRRQYYETGEADAARARGRSSRAWRVSPRRRSRPTGTCGRAAYAPSRWATCASTTTTSRSVWRTREARTNCAAASRPASATARWRMPPTRTCSRTGPRSGRSRPTSVARRSAGSDHGSCRRAVQPELTRPVMTVLVTGGTGFLGTSLVRRLLADGARVRVLARSPAKAEPLAEHGRGSRARRHQRPAPRSARAVDGAQVVYHLAGPLLVPGIPAEEYRRTHVTGTKLLLDCCEQQPGLRANRLLQHDRGPRGDG